MQRKLYLLLLASVLACGGNHAHEGDEEAGDDEDGSVMEDDGGPIDSDASLAASDAPVSKSDAGGRADSALDAQTTSALDAASREAGSALNDNRLQPFEVGRRWTYSRLTLDGGADAACMGSLVSSVTKTVTRDAAVGYEYVPTCFGTTAVQMFFEGDDIWAYVGMSEQAIHYAASPVEAGVSWQSSGIAYVWEAQEKVDVPAGSFDHCIRRSGPSSPGSYLLFCRGVGLVVSQNVLENARMELVSKNF
jgi:hypothetical protein